MPVVEIFEGFQNLRIPGFGDFQLTGQIPNRLVEMTKLEALDMSSNQLTCLIPDWSVQISESMDHSYLELSIFVQPNNTSNLQYNQLVYLPSAIYFGNNSLTGNIPVEIGRMKLLHILDISNNNFSGTIPDQISTFTNLEKLDLSGYNLSGKIPASLKNLRFLSYFSVANNNLHGLISAGGQFDTFSSSSYEGNPRLCGPILRRPCFDSSSTTQPLGSRQISPNKKLIVGLLFGILFVIGVISFVLALCILSNRRIFRRGDPDIVDLETVSFNSTSGIPAEIG
ncbi:hypothetical protein LguiB_021295 [Lonicera macranthoides]